MLEKIKEVNKEIAKALVLYIQYIQNHNHEFNEEQRTLSHQILSNLSFEHYALNKMEREYKVGESHVKFFQYYQEAMLDNLYQMQKDPKNKAFANTQEFLAHLKEVEKPAPLVPSHDFIGMLEYMRVKANKVKQSLS